MDARQEGPKEIQKFKKSYQERCKTASIPDSQLYAGLTEEQIRRLNQYEMKSEKYLGI